MYVLPTVYLQVHLYLEKNFAVSYMRRVLQKNRTNCVIYFLKSFSCGSCQNNGNPTYMPQVDITPGYYAFASF